MKRLACAFIAGFGLFAAVGAHATETIKLATLAPEGSPWYEITRELAESWKASSNGAIAVRIYPGGIAGDEDVLIRKMRVGQIQAAVLSAGGLADIVPEFRALVLPMMIGSYEELDYVLARTKPKLEALLEAKGFKVLNWGDAGWLHIFAQKPVISPDDLRPQRLFWWEAGGAYIEAWRGEGFNPVPLAATDMHTALQSGLVNAFLAPAIVALSFQWFALAPNMTDLNWAPLIGATVMTMSAWQKVPDELKPGFLQAARDAGSRMTKTVRGVEGQAVEVMLAHGLVVQHVPEAMTGVWAKAMRGVYPRLIGSSVPAEMAAEVEALVKEFRATRAVQ